MENTKTAAITAEGYTFRCANEEIFEKVKRAIEKMDSEDFIIKAENSDAENIGVSLRGSPQQVLVALGCTVESMVTDAGISPNIISHIVLSAIMRCKIADAHCETTEGSETK